MAIVLYIDEWVVYRIGCKNTSIWSSRYGQKVAPVQLYSSPEIKLYWHDFLPVQTGSAVNIWRNILICHFAVLSIYNLFINGPVLLYSKCTSRKVQMYSLTSPVKCHRRRKPRWSALFFGPSWHFWSSFFCSVIGGAKVFSHCDWRSKTLLALWLEDVSFSRFVIGWKPVTGNCLLAVV